MINNITCDQLITYHQRPVAVSCGQSFSGLLMNLIVPDWQPGNHQPLGNHNRKSGCHQSGSVGFMVFFWSYAPDFQTLSTWFFSFPFALV
jgi:hypothetical protein